MKKLGTLVAMILVVGGLATPAWSASSSRAAARAAAQAACEESDGTKVSIVVNVDGQSTRYSYRCSQLAAPTTTVKPQPYTPVPTDFEIGIIILEQQCFGSAGCLLKYRIDVKYVGTQTPDPTKTFEVIYTVNGGETPKTNRFTITGSRVSYPREESLQTPPDPVLTATATNVLADS